MTKADMKRELVDNVWTFLDKTADMYGKMRAERFSQEMHANCLELGMQSPIEDMFWIACQALAEAAFVPCNPGPEMDKNWEPVLGYGLFIQPQRQIGTYHVDFLLTQNNIGPDSLLRPLVVELDGHDFHDKDKRQRSYEKARDRFLVKEGYRVIHFTGSDVVADPFKVAYEALELLGVFNGTGTEEYNPADPLGQGN